MMNQMEHFSFDIVDDVEELGDSPLPDFPEEVEEEEIVIDHENASEEEEEEGNPTPEILTQQEEEEEENQLFGWIFPSREQNFGNMRVC